MIGTTVDRYEILEELGHGGMSVVYRGLDSSLERDVAVKVLHNHLAKKLENRRRFHREAKAIARLRHPNILEVYDFSAEEAERSYIVMEYIAGENLRQFVARTDTPPPEVAALFSIEICNALEHAHDHGIIHRDLKPENVMVSASGEVKLMDFGIAHVIDAETMTATGSLMGSPAHMAPELIDGEKVDVRADVFALGTVLYWLSTGALPFDGANAPQVLKRVLSGDYDDIELVEPRVGKRMGAIIERCLAHSPADRYASVAAARKDLVQFVSALGLADERTELKRYIKNPPAYRVEFEDQIVDRLMTLARQAERERDVTGAIAIFNRILAYDPENREVQRLLDRLCAQDRWRRLAPPAIGIAALIAAIVAWNATRPPPPPEVAVVEETPTDLLPAEAAAQTSDVVNTSAAVAAQAAEDLLTGAVGRASNELLIAFRTAENTASGQPALEPLQELRAIATPTPMKLATKPDMGSETDAGEMEVATHTWKFRISPPAATFTIDGRPVDPLVAISGVDLTEGVHLLRAESKGTKPWSKRLKVSGDGEEVIVLEWEPARVEVQSNANALVWFDGSLNPQPLNKRRVFVVPFGPADSTENQRSITVRAAHVDDVGNPKSQRVNVVAGNTHPVTFSFDDP